MLADYAGALAASDLNKNDIVRVSQACQFQGVDEWACTCLLTLRDGRFALLNGSQWHERTTDYNGFDKTFPTEAEAILEYQTKAAQVASGANDFNDYSVLNAGEIAELNAWHDSGCPDLPNE